MSIISDFGLNTPARKLILLVLSIPDKNNDREVDIVHINKIIKLYEENINKKEIEFSNYDLGAVSYEISQNIELLEEYGLIEEIRDETYQLTDYGETTISELKELISYEELLELKKSKLKLIDLKFNELLYYMYKKFPETQENSTQIKKLEIMKKNIIKSFLKKNKINIKTANEWLNEDLKPNIYVKSHLLKHYKFNINEYMNKLEQVRLSGNENDFILFFSSIFENYGTLALNFKNEYYEVDMALWIDELTNVTGNPILIEFKLGNINRKNIDNVGKMLLRNMVVSDVRYGIIVYLDKTNKDLRIYNEKFKNIIIINAFNLVEKLAKFSFYDIIRSYINEVEDRA